MPEHITDADLTALTTRKSLLERAKDAERERLRTQKAEQDAEYDGLCDEAMRLMHEILGLTEGEISQVGFERGMHNTERVKVEFEVERFAFRVRNKIEPIKITRSDGEVETVAYNPVPVFEFRPKRTNNWQEFECLADLGRPFGVTLDG